MNKYLILIFAIIFIYSCSEDSPNKSSGNTVYMYESTMGENNTILMEGGVEVEKENWNAEMKNEYDLHKSRVDSIKSLGFELKDDMLIYHRGDESYDIPMEMKGDTVIRIITIDGESLKTPFAVKRDENTLELHLNSLTVKTDFGDFEQNDWNLLSTEEILKKQYDIDTDLPENNFVYHFKTKFTYKKN